MKYLLITTVVFWILFGWSAYSASHAQGDNFGAAFPAIFCGAVSTILTVVYISLVFWNHRFL